MSPTRAQQPDVRPYVTEEDLWEALQQGEITFDEYRELLDAHRVGTDDVLLPHSDWEALPGSDAGYLTPPDSSQSITSFQPAPRRSRAAWRWSSRSGYEADLGRGAGGDGYTTVRLQNRRWRALADWEHDDGEGKWRRRTLVWTDHGITAQVGSIEPRWGRGLVIGRRSRVITTGDLAGTLMQPTRARFNGVWVVSSAERPLAVEAIASDIRSGELIDRVVGMQISVGRQKWRVAVNALSGEIARRDTNGAWTQEVFGGHVAWRSSRRQLLAEIAVDDSGNSAKAVEAVWRMARGRAHLRAWSYSPRHVNPWGGGPGHADTRTVTLMGIDEGYSSRTAGERGFHVATQFVSSPTLTWRWEWMTHKEEPTDPAIHHWLVRTRWRPGRLTVTGFARGRIDGRTGNMHSLGTYINHDREVTAWNARLETGRASDGDPFVRAGSGLERALTRHVLLAPAVRWIDPDLHTPADGYWYFYLTETIQAAAPVRVEVALTWKKFEATDRADQWTVRLRCVTRGL